MKPKLSRGRLAVLMEGRKAGGELFGFWELVREVAELAEEEMCVWICLICTESDGLGCEVGRDGVDGLHGFVLGLDHVVSDGAGEDFNEECLLGAVRECDVDSAGVGKEANSVGCS